MKISSKLQKAVAEQKPLISYEIVPPPRGRTIRDIIEVTEILALTDPAWIDVTSHSSSANYHELDDGTIQRKTYRKRPGTLGICGIIQNRFKIDTVAHLLCLGFTCEETEDALIELNYLGIENIFALRGDAPNFKKEIRKGRSVNLYASDLVEQIKDLNQGKFLEEIENTAKMDFSIGVAAYPEKHFEAPSLKTDIHFLKKKVDAGADYIITQMFFDNKNFFSFVQQCRQAGITVPIIPGLKIIKSVSQLTSLPKSFHIDIPDELVDEIHQSPQHIEEIGKRWALKQATELLNEKVPCVHFYVLNDVNMVTDVVKQLK